MSVLDEVLRKKRVASPKKPRSPKWPATRRKYLKLNPACEVCGETVKLEVHHKVPFDNNPDLELDLDNLMTLCECATGGIICHLAIGHCGDYTKYNPTVERDAAYFKEMLSNRLD